MCATTSVTPSGSYDGGRYSSILPERCGPVAGLGRQVTGTLPAHRARVRGRIGLLWCVLVGSATLVGLLLARLVPQGQPYDEPSHMGTVLQYAHGHPLPVMGSPGVTYEAQMGPVYYLFSALPARLAGDGDSELHALFVLRFGWLVLIPILGLLSFRLARALNVPAFAAASAASLVALNPTMLAIGASVQNDYLCIVFSCVAALVCCKALQPTAPLRVTILTGMCIGIAVLTKVTAGVLLIAFVFAVLTDARVRLGKRWGRVLAATATTLAICGWWFVRNLVEYGDLTGAAGVQRTGVSFSPMEFRGVSSVLSWVRSLISYGFAPTEYYRNAFHTPMVIRLVAVVMCLLAVLVTARSVAPKLGGIRHLEPPVLFAACAVLLTFVGYAITAWMIQEIAPRLMFVVAPLGVAILARLGGRGMRILLLVLVATFFVLDIWLVIEVSQMPANPVLWRMVTH